MVFRASLLLLCIASSSLAFAPPSILPKSAAAPSILPRGVSAPSLTKGAVRGGAQRGAVGGVCMVESADELQKFRSGATDALKTLVNAGKTSELKLDMLLLADETERGLTSPEGSEARAKMLAIVEEVEKSNPTPNPLDSSLINGAWTLRWTTSTSILGGTKPKFLRPDPARPILQMIDVATLTARNEEPRKLLGTKYVNSVDAVLEPMSKSKVAVQFIKFNILGGKLSIKAPKRARGELDTTYLSDTLRISRGDRGNVFILTK